MCSRWFKVNEAEIMMVHRLGVLNTFFFFFFCHSAACRNSQAKDQAHDTAVTRATAVTTLDP